MKIRHWSWALICAVPLAGAGAEAAEKSKAGAGREKKPEEFISFGTLKSPSPEAVRTQALEWLKGVGKADAAALKEFGAIWDEQAERSLLERVSSTLALGDAEAARLLKEARDPSAPAPMEVPAVFKDAKRPAFFRANLGLAFARSLSNRRVFEEALDVLRLIKPDQVVDPSAYFFHRAVAEHALLLKDEAARSIIAVIEDVADAPDRYKMVSVLMLYDMQRWRDKDLGWIARKMDNIERRLELARGGPQTQKIQKEVVARLDELIKQIENQNKDGSNGSGCPSGGPPGNQPGPGTNNPSNPMKDSQIANNGGPGNVDQKRLRNLAENWGKLPEKERAKAMAELTRDMPPRYREVIEKYFKDIAKNSK